MFSGLDQTWSREAIGYRQGELDDGDALATIVVVLIGGPALIVGSALIAAGGLSVGQALLIAPIAALLGAGVVGSSALTAAQTGTSGTELMRPSFGRLGASVVSLVRLLMVSAWAVVGLQLAGDWTSSAGSALGAGIDARVWIAVLALLGLVLATSGVVTTVRTVVRKPLFVASVLIVAVLGWRLVSNGFDFSGGGTGSFWEGLQRAVEASVIFVPFVEALARRLHDEKDATSSFAVGYAVAATLMIAAGAVIALRFESLGEFVSLEAGTAGAALVIAWVVVAEVDQAFAAFVAAGSDSVGIFRFLPPWVIGLTVAVAIGGAAVALPPLSVEVASLLTALVFPAALIALFDFQLVRERYYTEADIGAGQRPVNSTGLACWLVAVLLGQLLDPIGPDAWVGAVPSFEMGVDLPWRLVMALLMATAYMLISRWSSHRRSAVYEIRGVSTYGRED